MANQLDFRVKNGLFVGGGANITGAITSVDSIQLDTAATYAAPGNGKIVWNETDSALEVGLGNDVVASLPETTLYHVTNNTGSTIAKGTLVASVGTVGNSGKILIAPYLASSHTPIQIMGITAESIANGATGHVAHFGKVRGIQTNGGNYGEVWVDGDILYAKSTGGLTKTLPAAPNTKTSVAIVVNSHVSNGTLFVRPTLSSSIANDDLVQLTSIANGDLLVYNSTTARFENKTRQDTLDGLAGAVTTGFYLRGNGTDVVMSAIQAGDVPTLNQSTSGTAAVATAVTLVATDTANATHYLTFVDTATGNENLRTDVDLGYNPLFNRLLANGMIGVSASELQLSSWTNPAAGNWNGADISLNGGTAKGTGTGGATFIRAGAGSTNQSAVGVGGNISILAGAGSRNSDGAGNLVGQGGDGGSITITAGTTDNGGSPASISLAGGKGAGTLPSATTISAASAGVVTNAVGGNLQLSAGAGTGSGGGGSIIFSTAPTGSSGSTLNTLTQRWQITPAGILQSIGAQTIQTSTGVLTLATAAGNGNILISPHGTGNVGIGATTPLAKLSVGNGSVTDANVPVQISTTANTGYVYFGANKNGTQGAFFGYDNTSFAGLTLRNVVGLGNSGDGMSFVVNNSTEAIRIKSNGFVGIANTNPLACLQVEELGIDTTTTSFSIGNAAGTIYSVAATAFRTMELMVQITQGSSYHSVKLFVLHNGTDVWFNQTNVLHTAAELGTFSMDISGGNVRLIYTQTSSAVASTVKVAAIMMAV